jgi:hypothetical protein
MAATGWRNWRRRFLGLRDPQTWQTLAKWIGVQVKTTEAGSYAYEDQNGFEYLIKLGATTAK